MDKERTPLKTKTLQFVAQTKTDRRKNRKMLSKRHETSWVPERQRNLSSLLKQTDDDSLGIPSECRGIQSL